MAERPWEFESPLSHLCDQRKSTLIRMSERQLGPSCSRIAHARTAPDTKSGGQELARTDQDDAHRYVLTRSSVLTKTILPVC